MLIKQIKVEFLKEKRSANRKMLFIVPIIFVIFTYIMSMMMGGNSYGKSFLISAAYNWYPLLILPVVISLYVSNIVKKEKSYNQSFYKSLGLDTSNLFIAKNAVVLFDFFIIICVSTIGFLILSILVNGENIAFPNVIFANFCLFFGILPIISFSFFISKFTNRVVLILINFIVSFPSAIIATKDYWWIFPWGYNLRMIAPILGIHPNGTILVRPNPLYNTNVITIGLILSISIYAILTVIQIFIERKENA
ncbi:lantibiotic immunity ABC transporter MutE/EpiE family permease subunit [Peptostreptococcus equinus]|uniref:Lantibiotic immunity ABC transporter MutE/EpiE family permease subunit n=1 Tax=Peptostreptococcus equinus TaxID=3003601 RepID=A0ABY7JMG8_9FIRM|nr:lantibiotic immunity ABC transporter MutE/EpiE family permease subunit [Peptostreptococcus sp. CBA3647]WAW14560.1 lantibiotic immunity ABC transporter MutE/EpiE family permease subunit [Peptostreptococcus sp. CBA3647]